MSKLQFNTDNKYCVPVSNFLKLWQVELNRYNDSRFRFNPNKIKPGEWKEYVKKGRRFWLLLLNKIVTDEKFLNDWDCEFMNSTDLKNIVGENYKSEFVRYIDHLYYIIKKYLKLQRNHDEETMLVFMCILLKKLILCIHDVNNEFTLSTNFLKGSDLTTFSPLKVINLQKFLTVNFKKYVNIHYEKSEDDVNRKLGIKDVENNLTIILNITLEENNLENTLTLVCPKSEGFFYW